jgi:anti-sigma B factor antagonist
MLAPLDDQAGRASDERLSSEVGFRERGGTMTFEMSRDGDGRTIKVAGELDIGTREQMEEAFREYASQGEDVRVDLSGVTFIDSCGLRALVTLTRYLDGDVEIVLVDPSQPVTRLLSLTGVDDVGIFRIEDGDGRETG